MNYQPLAQRPRYNDRRLGPPPVDRNLRDTERRQEREKSLCAIVGNDTEANAWQVQGHVSGVVVKVTRPDT